MLKQFQFGTTRLARISETGDSKRQTSVCTSIALPVPKKLVPSTNPPVPSPSVVSGSSLLRLIISDLTSPWREKNKKTNFSKRNASAPKRLHAPFQARGKQGLLDLSHSCLAKQASIGRDVYCNLQSSSHCVKFLVTHLAHLCITTRRTPQAAAV